MRSLVRTTLRRAFGLTATATVLAAGTTLAASGTASAHPGDNVCRGGGSGWVQVHGYNLLPCVYQDSSGKMHGKVTATGGYTDVYLHIVLGYRCNDWSVPEWLGYTDTPVRIWPGGGTLYTAPSSGEPVRADCQYFSMAYIVNSGHREGDVEAGPVVG
ncbi:hypothetical protein [Kitasatospora cinereorecta]|uniref:Secreted protein n=1 Tax=Kitasatospora cinereorecta TaxID=285560 RepID=A0ABW0V984_9ACTN